MVCGSSLEYLDQTRHITCSYCGKIEGGHIMCPNGHYICDHCHNRGAMEIIQDISHMSNSKDPFEIAELMMSYPGLPMLGCQHAYIASGALMAAIKNEGSRSITNNDMDEVFKRTEKQAHGGYCGLSGVCGIAPAIGACFSVLTGSKCGTTQEQQITMEAVTRVSRVITDLTGPSCCKAYVRGALEVSVSLLKDSLNIILPSPKEKATCTYSSKHPHGCREGQCPYFAVTVEPTRAALNMSKVPVSLIIRKVASTDSKMKELLKRALELGADNAKIISTDSVVVEEWARWKCQYGCALYEKDGCHPPNAPDAESTKKLMREYSTAVLLKGSKGKALTEIAVRLEGEAYHQGYYKAFALTALSSGGGSGST